MMCRFTVPFSTLFSTTRGVSFRKRGCSRAVREIQQWVTKMADEQLDRLESFRVFITAAEEGAAIPPVAERDLKCLHELCVERAKRYCGKDGVVSLDSMARACSPDANLPAVWLRHAELRSLYRQGLLAEWQQGTDLDDAVFRLAATIPINGIHLDQEAFVRHLRAGTAQPELTSKSPQLLQNPHNAR